MANPESILFEIIDYISDPNHEPLQLCRVYFELHYIAIIVYNPNGITEYLVPIDFRVPIPNGDLNNLN